VANTTFDAVVIGTSAGGLYALTSLFERLPVNFRLPVIVVQHRSKDERNLLEEVLSQKCKIRIIQANEKEAIKAGVVYIAPPDYHLLIERNQTFSLTSDQKVNYSRPSIDVLFETAAMVYKDRLLAIILTGANHDGAAGMKLVKAYGGRSIAQHPDTAQFPAMPKAAIDSGAIDLILDLKEISRFLTEAGKT
jgi:two-component system, chemotaxis family, protein-glutamate methylesterase/glutaminase